MRDFMAVKGNQPTEGYDTDMPSNYERPENLLDLIRQAVSNRRELEAKIAGTRRRACSAAMALRAKVPPEFRSDFDDVYTTACNMYIFIPDGGKLTDNLVSGIG